MPHSASRRSGVLWDFVAASHHQIAPGLFNACAWVPRALGRSRGAAIQGGVNVAYIAHMRTAESRRSDLSSTVLDSGMVAFLFGSSNPIVLAAAFSSFHQSSQSSLPSFFLLRGCYGRSQRDGRPPHSAACRMAAYHPSIKSPLRTSRISPVARPFRWMEITARTPVAGCTPLAISSPFASAAMNALKAATAASHACCIGSERVGRRTPLGDAPRREIRLSAASRDHRKLPDASGRRPSSEELRRMVVGDGRSMALHRLDLNYPLEEYLVERPRWFLRGHGDSGPQLYDFRGRFPIAVTVPGRHQRPPTLEQVAAPIAAFNRALDAMPERLLDHLVRKARASRGTNLSGTSGNRASPPGLRGRWP